MRLIILFLFFIFSISSEASGLFRLTEFPEKKFYLEAGAGINYSELTSHKDFGKVGYEQEPSIKTLIKGGYLYQSKHLFTIEADYISTKAGDSRRGEEPIYFEYYNGFQEPYFEYRFRHRPPTSSVNLLDYFIGIRPSVMDRKIGRNGLDTWAGRTMINVGLYHGSEIPGSKWEFQTLVQGTRFFAGKEENVKTGVTRKFKGTHEFHTRLNIAYRFMPLWMVYGGIGLKVFGDNNLDSSGNDLLLQRGTASNLNLGFKYLSNDIVFDLNFLRVRHDYFVRSESYAFDGDVESWDILLTAKREF